VFKNNFFKSGFTIVELIVAIVIIGILATVIAVSQAGVIQKATVASVQSDLTNNKNMLSLYYVENGVYPTTFDANNCPSAPVASENYCLKLSNGNTIDSYIAVLDDYDLVISSGSTAYSVSQATAPTAKNNISCPSGYIVVPGSHTYGTSDFCVMKYEAKNVGGVATSQAAGVPWVSISQNDSNTVSTAACSGCHLITESEWMTIAQNVLSVASNWSNDVVGSGYIYSGHNDNMPTGGLEADVNDANGYYGETNAGGNQRRTLSLTNGEVIWDFAGNVWDYTQGQAAGGQPGIVGGAWAWRDWLNVTAMGSLAVNIFPAGTGLSGSSNWNINNGIGQIYTSSDDATLRPVMRDGCFDNANNAGVLSFYTYSTPTSATVKRGFRVAK